MSVANILPEFRKLEEEVEDKYPKVHYFQFDSLFDSPTQFSIPQGTHNEVFPNSQFNLTLPEGMDWRTSVVEELTFTYRLSSALPAGLSAQVSENFLWNQSNGTTRGFAPTGFTPRASAEPGNSFIQQTYLNQQVAIISGGNLVYSTPYLQDNTTEGLYIDDLEINFTNSTVATINTSATVVVAGKVVDYGDFTGSVGKWNTTLFNTVV